MVGILCFFFPVVYEGTLILTHAHVKHDSPKSSTMAKGSKNHHGSVQVVMLLLRIKLVVREQST